MCIVKPDCRSLLCSLVSGEFCLCELLLTVACECPEERERSSSRMAKWRSKSPSTVSSQRSVQAWGQQAALRGPSSQLPLLSVHRGRSEFSESQWDSPNKMDSVHRKRSSVHWQWWGRGEGGEMVPKVERGQVVEYYVI